MKALVKYAPGPGNIDVCDVEEPRCRADQVKIKVDYCGVCGTDLHVYDGTLRCYPPVILGHEFTGTVVEVGREANTLKYGDRVAVFPISGVICGDCAYCRSGDFIFCPKRRGMGVGVNGGLTSYAVLREDQAYKVPDGLQVDQAALCEPLAAAVQAVLEVAVPRMDDFVLIAGPGPIGLLCLKLLVAAGIKAIVVGTRDDRSRLEAARRIGAAVTVNLGEQDLLDVVREETHGAGVDIALECAGHPESVRNCLETLRPRGKYIQVGICGRDVSFPIDTVLFKQVQMAGSVAYTARTWNRMMRILERGNFTLGDLITSKVPLAGWQEGFDLCMSKQGLKVLIYPDP